MRDSTDPVFGYSSAIDGLRRRLEDGQIADESDVTSAGAHALKGPGVTGKRVVAGAESLRWTFAVLANGDRVIS